MASRITLSSHGEAFCLWHSGPYSIGIATACVSACSLIGIKARQNLDDHIDSKFGQESRSLRADGHLLRAGKRTGSTPKRGVAAQSTCDSCRARTARYGGGAREDRGRYRRGRAE